jgi:hypothetical protein
VQINPWHYRPSDDIVSRWSPALFGQLLLRDVTSDANQTDDIFVPITDTVL